MLGCPNFTSHNYVISVAKLSNLVTFDFFRVSNILKCIAKSGLLGHPQPGLFRASERRLEASLAKTLYVVNRKPHSNHRYKEVLVILVLLI